MVVLFDGVHLQEGEVVLNVPQRQGANSLNQTVFAVSGPSAVLQLSCAIPFDVRCLR